MIRSDYVTCFSCAFLVFWFWCFWSIFLTLPQNSSQIEYEWISFSRLWRYGCLFCLPCALVDFFESVFVCVSVLLTVCLPLCLSVCLSVCLSACNCFVLLSACDCLSVCSQIVGSHSAILLLSWLSLVSFRVVIFVIQHLSVFSVWSLWWQRLPQHPNPRPNRKAKFRFSPLYTGPTFLSNSTYLSLQLLFCKSQFKSLDLWYARWRLLLALIYLSGNGVHY